MQRGNVTDPQSNNYKWFVLAILTVVYAFNFIDRQILVILQEPIKAELGLSDTQLGLLTGFSFAVVYVTAGIPIAWLADRSNRRNIVAVSPGIWSVMTALSGMVQNYTQLLLARLGVGLGEAGGSPPSHSMLSAFRSAYWNFRWIHTYKYNFFHNYILSYNCSFVNYFFQYSITLPSSCVIHPQHCLHMSCDDSGSWKSCL